jgi:hypothetical protein
MVTKLALPLMEPLKITTGRAFFTISGSLKPCEKSHAKICPGFGCMVIATCFVLD